MAVEIGGEVEVVVEVPRGSLVKWAADGSVDFLSPVPCPYNYGSILGTLGPDGDPEDAILLGPALGRGKVARWKVQGCLGFVDGGVDDPKWVCAAEPPTDWEWLKLRAFLRIYGLSKSVLNRLRRRPGPTGPLR